MKRFASLSLLLLACTAPPDPTLLPEVPTPWPIKSYHHEGPPKGGRIDPHLSGVRALWLPPTVVAYADATDAPLPPPPPAWPSDWVLLPSYAADDPLLAALSDSLRRQPDPTGVGRDLLQSAQRSLSHATHLLFTKLSVHAEHRVGDDSLTYLWSTNLHVESWLVDLSSWTIDGLWTQELTDHSLYMDDTAPLPLLAALADPLEPDGNELNASYRIPPRDHNGTHVRGDLQTLLQPDLPPTGTVAVFNPRVLLYDNGILPFEEEVLAPWRVLESAPPGWNHVPIDQTLEESLQHALQQESTQRLAVGAALRHLDLHGATHALVPTVYVGVDRRDSEHGPYLYSASVTQLTALIEVASAEIVGLWRQTNADRDFQADYGADRCLDPFELASALSPIPLGR